MLEIYTHSTKMRTQTNLKEIEKLGDLTSQMGIPHEPYLLEAFQRLIELAGSKEFYPYYSEMHQYVLKLKWSREGQWKTGYAVPWMSLYPTLGGNNQLVSIATYYTQSLGAHTLEYLQDGMEHKPVSAFRSPLIKPPINMFGNGNRPVEIHREEWTRILRSGMPKRYPGSFYRKAPQPHHLSVVKRDEKSKIHKREGQKSYSHFNSRNIATMLANNKFEAGNVAVAHGPDTNKS